MILFKITQKYTLWEFKKQYVEKFRLHDNFMIVIFDIFIGKKLYLFCLITLSILNVWRIYKSKLVYDIAYL